MKVMDTAHECPLPYFLSRILRRFLKFVFESSWLLLWHTSYFGISNALHLVLLWTSFEKRVQSCNRGLVPTISQMALSKNILITKKASDADPDATSSSSSDFIPVGVQLESSWSPIKCLLLRKERGSLFYSCQNHSLFHAATIWSTDPCDSDG